MIDLENMCVFLRKKTCTLHGEKPIAYVYENSIKLKCCCDKFEQEMKEQIYTEAKRQTDIKITEVLKDFV